MKSFFFATVFVFAFSSIVNAQPKSPRMEAKGNIDGVNVVIDYGAPSAKDRVIWGGLVPYYKVWRTGANEATTVEVDKDVIINGNELSAGKYALFTIPSKEKWTLIFNSEYNQWGAYKYDPAKDVLKVEVPISNGDFQEQMVISVEDATLRIHWEKVMVSVEVAAKG